MRFPFILICISNFLFYSCEKKDQNTCDTLSSGEANFQIYENILDTALLTDTAFDQRFITFIAGENTFSHEWKIGNDSRNFNTPNVTLYFTDPTSIEVSLRTTYIDDCKKELKTVSKNLTILDNDGSLISPLVGEYKGYNTDAPLDTFSVDIKFWSGTRYDWWPAGAYSIQNLPKGYFDSTQNFNGSLRPEITGIIGTNGYKNMAIEKPGYLPAKGIKGYISLKPGTNDSIFINYKIIDVDKLNQSGQISFLDKRFIGIRKR